MDAAFEQKVRERAYEIWKAAGEVDGSADLHWHSAEQAMMNESASLKEIAAKMKRATVKPAAKAGAKGGKRRAA